MVIMEERRFSSSLSWHSSTWDRSLLKLPGVQGVWKSGEERDKHMLHVYGSIENALMLQLWMEA